MAVTELPFFPRGQLSFGAGDLTQVSDVSFNFTNNGSLRHTLKRSPAGKVLGNTELSGSFTVLVDEDGPERDYFTRVENGEDVSMRLKLPGVTKNIVGFLTSIDGTIPVDNAVELSVSFSGRFSA